MPTQVQTSQPNLTTKGRRRKRNDTDTQASEGEAASFDVYHSAALTFQNTGQFRKAIDAYTKV